MDWSQKTNKMNRFLLLALTAGLLSPIAAKAESIPQISDWDATFTQPYRLLFTCPAVITKEINEGRLEKKSYGHHWKTNN